MDELNAYLQAPIPDTPAHRIVQAAYQIETLVSAQWRTIDGDAQAELLALAQQIAHTASRLTEPWADAAPSAPDPVSAPPTLADVRARLADARRVLDAGHDPKSAHVLADDALILLGRALGAGNTEVADLIAEYQRLEPKWYA